jgi:hypothetical protein
VSDSSTLDVFSARYVASSNRLLIGGASHLASFDAGTGAVIRSSDVLHYPSFAADGVHAFGVTAVTSATGAVLDLESGRQLPVAADKLELDPVAVDEARYFLSHYEGNVLITQTRGSVERSFWSADGQSRLGTTGAAEGFANQRIAVSGDGRYVAVHRLDSTVEIDDLRSGAVIGLVPVAHDDPKAGYTFSGDGTRLLVTEPPGVDPSHRDGLVSVTDLRRETWIADACRTAGRQLTPSDYRRLTGAEPPNDLSCR